MNCVSKQVLRKDDYSEFLNDWEAGDTFRRTPRRTVDFDQVRLGLSLITIILIKRKQRTKNKKHKVKWCECVSALSSYTYRCTSQIICISFVEMYKRLMFRLNRVVLVKISRFRPFYQMLKFFISKYGIANFCIRIDMINQCYIHDTDNIASIQFQNISYENNVMVYRGKLPLRSKILIDNKSIRTVI